MLEHLLEAAAAGCQQQQEFLVCRSLFTCERQPLVCVAATGRLQLSSIRGPGEQSPWGGSHAASKARGTEAGEARLFPGGCSKPTFQTTLNLARKDESGLAHSFCLHSTNFL